MQNSTLRVAQIFWGLALVAVDLKLGRFDVLPDFAGYILVALGAAGLGDWSRQFPLAKLASWAMAGFSLALALFTGSFVKILWLASLVVDGLALWLLLGGFIDFARSQNRLDWIQWGSLGRRAYVALLGVAFLTSLIAPAVPSLAQLLGTVTFIATLVVLAGILYLLHQVKAATKGALPIKGTNPFTVSPTADDLPSTTASVANPPASDEDRKAA
jgi:hypothetical protein